MFQLRQKPKPTPKYQVTLEQLDKLYERVLFSAQPTEGPFPAVPTQNQTADAAAQAVIGIGELHAIGEYRLLRLFLIGETEKLQEIFEREYAYKHGWERVCQFAEIKLNPKVVPAIQPRPTEFKAWPCGCLSSHSLPDAATRSETRLKGGVVCVGYNPKRKSWGGCGARFIWDDTTNSWVIDRRNITVTDPKTTQRTNMYP